MIENLIEKAGLYANLAGASAIVSGVALFIFFAGVGIFGPINDVTSIFQFLFLIPLMLLFHRLLSDQAPTLVTLISIASFAAVLIFALLQAALVLGLVRFEQSLPYVLLSSGVVGLWFLAGGLLSLRMGSFPGGLAWVGVLCVMGYILGLIGFWIGGQQHPLAAIGFLAAFVAVPVWCFWLARLLNTGRLPTALT